jgi:hypothetical protein
MTTPFWSNEPSIIFNKNYIFNLWPTPKMSFEEKMNAITRMVLLLSLFGFVLTRNWTFIVVGIVTIAVIYFMHKRRKNVVASSLSKKKIEGFNVMPAEEKFITNPVTLERVLQTDYHPITKKNPFGNVLLTDIGDNPERPSAAPSFNPDVNESINSEVKKQTQMLNPGIINTSKQIYGDLKDNYDLDQSMRRFYSTANTRVANDANAFASWLYGDMYSSKESNAEGAVMRVKDNVRYLLI